MKLHVKLRKAISNIDIFSWKFKFFAKNIAKDTPESIPKKKKALN